MRFAKRVMRKRQVAFDRLCLDDFDWNLSNQVLGSMGSRNGNVVRGTLLKLGFNTTGTRLFPRSRNEECGQVPGFRLLRLEQSMG
jgi:hypothetical protein